MACLVQRSELVKAITTSLVVIAILFGTSSAFAQGLTVRAGAIFLHRAGDNTTALIVDGGAPVVNTGQLDFDLEPGFDVGITRQLNSSTEIQFRYFQVDSWSAINTSTLGGGSAIATNPTAALGAVTATHALTSALYSGELNVKRVASDWLTVLAGFRMIQVDEHLAQNVPGTGFYTMDTDNHLYGFQVGADGLLMARGPLEISAISKAGIYGNSANQHFHSDFPVGAFDVNQTLGDDLTSFVGEVQINGQYQLTNNVSIQGGYQMMWISGVALAPDQIGTIPGGAAFGPARRVDSSDVLYVGGSVLLVLTR